MATAEIWHGCNERVVEECFGRILWCAELLVRVMNQLMIVRCGERRDDDVADGRVWACA
jgi:hypothetical protein